MSNNALGLICLRYPRQTALGLIFLLLFLIYCYLFVLDKVPPLLELTLNVLLGAVIRDLTGQVNRRVDIGEEAREKLRIQGGNGT